MFYVKTVKKQVQLYLIRLKRFIIYSYIYLRVHRAGAFDTMLHPSPLLFLCRFNAARWPELDHGADFPLYIQSTAQMRINISWQLSSSFIGCSVYCSNTHSFSGFSVWVAIVTFFLLILPVQLQL